MHPITTVTGAFGELFASRSYIFTANNLNQPIEFRRNGTRIVAMFLTLLSQTRHIAPLIK